MEKLKTPSFIAPKSINELISALIKYPDAQLFAGGTYIMSRMGYYPNQNPRDIISLSDVAELTRVVHIDKYVELGSMVTIRQLVSSSAFFLSEPLRKAIEDIGTSVIRRQSTIGGALSTQGIRFVLPCILSVVGAQVEIKTVGHKSGPFKSKTVDRWLPVSKLYDEDGTFVFENKGFISRIRIPSEQNTVQLFRTVGDPMHEPSSTVVMGLTYTVSQDKMTQPRFCLVLPKGGFFYSQDFNNILSKVALPLSTNAMVKLAQDLDKELVETCKGISEVQRERTKRLLIKTLYEASSAYLYS